MESRKKIVDLITVKRNSSIKDTLVAINKGALGTALIIDDEDKFCGLVTDGDIRRLLLAGYSTDTKIEKVMQKNPVTVKKGASKEEILKLMSSKIKHIPILDSDNKIVDLASYAYFYHIPVAEPNLEGKELEYITECIATNWISSGGKYVEKFENDFSDYCGCRYGIAVSNGTVALHLALLSLDVGKGDEVIVPDLTFVATINAVLHSGATPVIVDIELDSWCINPEVIEKAINPRTKAIIPVHLYGQPCDMEAIMNIAKNHNLFVIEDCAEAHGAKFDGKRVGSFGNVGCFSFFGNKVITTGEGGMCVTNSKELNEKMRILRDHGMSKTRKYWHEVVGYNYRMTNLQAAVGVAQLERIDEILRARKKIEDEYKKLLSNIEFIEFQRDDLPKREKILWLVSALIKNNKREAYITKLKESEIDARPFFYPLSEMDIYKKYIFSNRNSLKISKRGINLPTSTNLNKSIFDKISKVFKNQ